MRKVAPLWKSSTISSKQSRRIGYNQIFSDTFWNPRSDVRQGLSSAERQDITTYQYPTIPNSLPSKYIKRQSPYQPTNLPHKSSYLPLDPFILSSRSTHREGNGSFLVVSKKRNRNDANSEDDLGEPPRKSRRSMRHPIYIRHLAPSSKSTISARVTSTPSLTKSNSSSKNRRQLQVSSRKGLKSRTSAQVQKSMAPSKKRTQGDADIYDGSEGDKEMTGTTEADRAKAL